MIKWSGMPFSYRDNYKTIYDFVHLDLDIGTLHDNVEIIMRKEYPNMKINKINKKTIKRMMSHLKTGCILMSYKKQSYHSALVIKTTPYYFYIVNHSRSKLISRVHKNTMKKYLKDWNLMYFINLKEKI